MDARSFAIRSIVVALILALVTAVALGKLAWIQLFQGQATAEAATRSRTVPHTLKAQRGRILDANGMILAQSVERYTIVGSPKAAADFIPVDCTKQTEGNCHAINGKPVGATGPAAVARILAPTLGMNQMELGAKLVGSNSYVVLKKDVTPQVKRAIDKLGLAGVISAELSNQRSYPHRDLMGSLLGGVDANGKGVAGIEYMEDAALTGKDGYEVYQQGMYGQQIPGTESKSQPPVDGKDVRLTIDGDVQWYVQKALADGKAKYHAGWVMAVVQEPSAGRIIALADTESKAAGSAEAKMNPPLVVTQTFEPGSIGKTITLSGMLQEGTRQMTDKFTVPDRIKVDGQEYHDATEHGPERWTMAGILQNSSNVGMVMASDKYTDQQRYEYLTKFGIGQSSGLGLQGESKGLLTPPSAWDRRTRNTVLFGQGYATNAIQLTNAVATIANKGVRNQQSLIKSVSDEDGKPGQSPSSQATRVIDEQVAAQVMNGMESVADKFKNVAAVDGYRVASKTGTAEVAGQDGRLTSIISDWVGVIPADNPRFVVTVVMKDPQGTFGGLTAGPVFAQIGEFLMQKYELPPSAPRTDAIPVQW
ncbi:peptidoglycan D,D-transpeptidase FtsI family protein [Bifidobacterium actinocoloniiforme]|uniref:peptidoglycan D,D-transpeptidase FtsI family protein n=1 Tax=Bifidobacterium actinocoloniiforme TaxID=638619 RepID=UPI0005297380|nr:penicillin-binding protein 2 [Bifidobacterium actinocoloniiforme]AKV56033.1 cell division protein [Bifidobacterium actinocoloniiforme DSM 22766]